MTINEARTLANIADRAKSITADYNCTIFTNSVLVTRKGEPTRSYEVRDGVCKCPSYDKNRTCKHLLGLPALIEAEMKRLAELSTVLDDKATCFEGIQNGRELLDAHLCEMGIEAYRNALTLSMDYV